MLLEELKKQVEMCLEVAKDMLVERGYVEPVAVFSKWGEVVPYPLALGSDEKKDMAKYLVQGLILKTQPDSVVMVTEGWMLDVRTANKEETEKIIENYQYGDAEKSPNRMEVILVDGGAVGQRHTVIQPFKHVGQKIVFEERLKMPDGGHLENTFFGNAWDILEGEGKVKH